jgi:hypothetical protein
MRAELSQLLITPIIAPKQCSCGYLGRIAMDHLSTLQSPRFALLPNDLSNKSVAEAIELASGLPSPPPANKSVQCKDFRQHSLPLHKAVIQSELARFKAEQFGLCLQCIKGMASCTQHPKA